MKNVFLRTAKVTLAIVFTASGFAFGQAGTVRTQNAWARPILKLNGNVVPPGSTLLPDTRYAVTLQALSPIASDNNGTPVLNVLYIQDGDGFVPSTSSGIPFGVDVPVPGGRGYAGDVYLTTNSAADLPPQIYIRYRGVTFENDPTTNTSVGTPTIRIQQALLP
jgi:hypothetical protein